MTKKGLNSISILLFLAIVFVGVIIALNDIKSNKLKFQEEEINICNEEDSLHFDGIITDYSGYGHKSRPIYLLINDSSIHIPRYNNEIALYVGDTIKKLRKSHTYYIQRSSTHRNITGKPRDTISFNCE